MFHPSSPTPAGPLVIGQVGKISMAAPLNLFTLAPPNSQNSPDVAIKSPKPRVPETPAKCRFQHATEGMPGHQTTSQPNFKQTSKTRPDWRIQIQSTPFSAIFCRFQSPYPKRSSLQPPISCLIFFAHQRPVWKAISPWLQRSGKRTTWSSRDMSFQSAIPEVCRAGRQRVS